MTRINGAQIRIAREEKRLSQKALASAIGITSAGLSKLEKGETMNPTADTIGKLSSALNKPIDFFYMNNDEGYTITNAITFRSFTNASKGDNLYTTIILKRSALFLAYIYKFIYDRKPNLPEDIKNSPESLMDDASIESLTAKVRRMWNMPEGPVSNLITWLENNGILCIGYDLPETIDSVNASFSFPGCGSNPHPVIIYNINLNYFRQRFTLAHELGHIILHKDWDDATYMENHSDAENQAHRFASAFMMPRETFRASVGRRTVNGALALKYRWGMSVAAIGRRLNNTGLIDNQKFRFFQIEVSKKGWRKEEPGDRDIAPEKPYCLERMYRVAFENNCISTLSVLTQFGLYPDEIVRFIGNSDKFVAVPNDDCRIKEVGI